jgi:tetratricopeptide (TPR) repeat protein
MDYGKLPHLPVLEGKDASYPDLSSYSNEYFFQNDFCTAPWETAVYKDGYAYGEMSTAPLTYRKIFCWGNGRGGRRWQDFLSLPGEEYLELQAGLAPTQLHTADISGGETVDWVQAFTAFKTDPEKAHQHDYDSAAEHIGNHIKQMIDPAALQSALAEGRKRSETKAAIINMGSGWGALEEKLRKRPCPAGLSFPEESIGSAEAPWAEFLQTGNLPLRPPETGPGSFVMGNEWERLLALSPARKTDWLTPYHLGVIAFEKGDSEKAGAFWQESIRQAENPWAYRNLAQVAIQAGDTAGALDYYRKALAMPESADISFAGEYIPLLLAAGNDSEARAELDICLRRAGSLEALSVPLLEAAARMALNAGDDALLDKIFSIEHAHIREGNTTMVDIWAEREIRRLNRAGISRAEAETQVLKSLANGSLVPPHEIDFRMYTGLVQQLTELPNNATV